MQPNVVNLGLQRRDVPIALVATIIIHASVFAGVVWGGWFDVAKISSLAKPKHRLVTVNLPLAAQKKKPELKNQFVPVSQKTEPEPPPERKTSFYSNADTVAANPEPPDKHKDTPRIKEGIAMVPGTVNSLIPAPTAARSVMSRPSLDHLRTSAKAKPSNLMPNISTFNPASITVKQINPIKDFTSRQNNNSRPSAALKTTSSLLPALPDIPKAPTLREAKAGLGSRNMKQEGGVSRKGPAALDVRLTGYGDYDARFFAAISIAWRKQIKSRTWSPSQIVVDFSLFHDGRIEDLTVQETNAAAILQYFCRESIQQPAPFEQWTEDMRKQLGSGPRRCRITFNYLVR
jgi:hypothetical protein